MVAPCVAVLALLLTGLPLNAQPGDAHRGAAAAATPAPGAQAWCLPVTILFNWS
jgi:hypothetical protein